MTHKHQTIFLIIFLLAIVIWISFHDFHQSQPNQYDVNQDGKVNSLDAKIVYDVFLDCYQPTPEMVTRCDIDGDGFITDKDPYVLMNYILTHDSQGNVYESGDNP